MSSTRNSVYDAYAVWPATNLGPLTTTFTPTPQCFQPIHSGSRISDSYPYAYVYGKHCTTAMYGDALAPLIQDDPSCLPSAIPPGTPSPFYSPGNVCPQGFTTACHMTRGMELSSDLADPTMWEMWKVLQFGETAYKCCPSGYVCAMGPTGCSKSPGGPTTTSGPYITYPDHDSCESTTSIGILSITDYQPGLLLVTSSAQPEQTNGPYPVDQVPLGAQIFIAICAPIAVIALALAGCVLVRTRMHSLRKQSPIYSSVPPENVL
ncbi:uncharacterized protein BO72DRAFT_524181 [Aspergillus fijiensis CBS 313.89]|uniref:Uncharacterized protein n=1 Tax=Aspergillus fijiensis CBS 313.89 TaxID=1448319 RepID=A0A8G1W3P0_9EURO|nr:uncharacterized protein BO72DRAFT_524181 [Aspergillus fijiensis CBS 313.89]RAK81766.1 hypothetical protein BO72DRAFT_524181 [Aspergillus fijiensis CBS 313.89]